MRIEAVPVSTGPAALDVLPRLRAAMAGGAPMAPYAAAAPPPPPVPYAVSDLPADLALVVGTSGTTGTPKRALLSAPSLDLSAESTAERIGGEGQWLLALPAHHIAGLQVLLRSLRAGTTPVTMAENGPGFSTAAFADAAYRMESGVRHFTSLVPTQLIRLLDDPRAHDALRSFDAILVGGAALPPTLRRRADAADVRLVATYGMSETGGGCVYDGRTLTGAQLAFDDEERVYIGGGLVAHGYCGRPDLTRAAFGTDEDGVRWFRTDDVGHLDDDGRLHVDGRIDDLINTGGLKVAPRYVEEAIVEHIAAVTDCVVVGAADPHWGEAVSALVVLDPTELPRELSAADVRAALRGILPDHALPHRLRAVEEIPTRAPGKPDRRAVTALFDVRD